MKIRQAIKGDKEFVRKQDAENMIPIFKLYGKNYPIYKNKMFDYFRTKSCFIIEDKELPLGFIYFSIGNKKLEIWNIQIKKSYQNKGYGKKLIKHMINYAKKRKLKRIILETHGKNKQATKFYEKSGFKNIGMINKEKDKIGFEFDLK